MGGIISPRVCLIWKVVLFTQISPPKMGCSHNIGSITQRWGFKDAINVGDQWHVESGHNNDHYTPIIFAPITCNIQTCWIELYRHGMMFGTCTYGCFLKWDGTPNHPKYSIFLLKPMILRNHHIKMLTFWMWIVVDWTIMYPAHDPDQHGSQQAEGQIIVTARIFIILYLIYGT